MNHHRNNKYNPEIHRRRSIRLPEYDYSQNGGYFITICTHERCLLFNDDTIKRIVEAEWLATSRYRRDVIVDEFVVMPNHVHGIIVINHPLLNLGAHWRTDNDKDTASIQGVCNTLLQSKRSDRKLKSLSQTIGAIVRGIKAASTNKIRQAMGKPDMQVWQRGYYEHVIRNQNDLDEVRKYIVDNLAKWDSDKYNPPHRHIANDESEMKAGIKM